MRRQLYIIALSLGIFVSAIANVGVADLVSAHRSGCHRWHSCPSDTGSYICGDLGDTSGCPIAQPPQVSTPQVPVVTSKEVTSSADVPFTTNTLYDAREYPGYEKVTQGGASGSKTTVTKITYTSGVETSRSTISDHVTTPAIARIVVKGSRARSIGYFTSVHDSKPGWFNHNKGKYDIEGFYKPNSKVVLSLATKQLATASTNKDGYFRFENIKPNPQTAWLELFEKKDGKTNSVSEKTQVNFASKKLIEEYKLLHGGVLN